MKEDAGKNYFPCAGCYLMHMINSLLPPPGLSWSQFLAPDR